MEWTVFCLANHYDVQDKLREEIESVLGGSSFTLDAGPQMPYLQAVILESMRFGPFAPIPPPRRATQRAYIDGFDIPEGTTIFTNMHVCTRDAEFFPDAAVFRPERFLERTWEPISGSSTDFAPFSVGPRMCPGSQLAMLNISTIICMLLQNYKVTFSRAASNCTYHAYLQLVRPTDALIDATVSSGLVASPTPAAAIKVRLLGEI